MVPVLSEFRTADSASRLRQMRMLYGRTYLHVTGETPSAGSNSVRVPVEQGCLPDQAEAFERRQMIARRARRV